MQSRRKISIHVVVHVYYPPRCHTTPQGCHATKSGDLSFLSHNASLSIYSVLSLHMSTASYLAERVVARVSKPRIQRDFTTLYSRVLVRKALTGFTCKQYLLSYMEKDSINRSWFSSTCGSYPGNRIFPTICDNFLLDTLPHHTSPCQI